MELSPDFPFTSKKNIALFFSVWILLILCYMVVPHISFDSNIVKNQSRIIMTSSSLTRRKENASSSFFASNSTHLWNMRLIDDEYFRIANLLPCHVVEYLGGPKKDKIDSCDHSLTNEYSIEISIHAQKCFFEHQHPVDCSNKRFAIIHNFTVSGFGSTIHQTVWAFGEALAQGRIGVYASPGNWIYGSCPSKNLDCLFLPISNCSIPSLVDGNKTIHIEANKAHWGNPIHPSVFQLRSFNWYRSQLLFYLMRFNPQTLAYVQRAVSQSFIPPSIDANRPFIAIYVRRSDKVKNKEMSQSYTIKQYFDLFDDDARQANITTVYLNSEDENVFKEFEELKKIEPNRYKLLSIAAKKDIVFGTLTLMSEQDRGKIILEFLTDPYIEIHSDLHAGTLTSNYCRLVDEIRLVLGKTIPFYTPENQYLLDMLRERK